MGSIPHSPHQSGLQISVGHFSYVVSQKMDQILAQRKISVVLHFPHHRHKAGGAAHWLSCVACFELSAIVYADNDAVLTDYTNILKIDSTNGGICHFRHYGAPAAGSSIPKGHSSRSAVAVLEVSLRKNSLCDFWLRLSQAVSIFASIVKIWATA